MKRDLRAFAAMGALLPAMAGTDTALAQKPGGILRMSHFDSPASMSMHEEAIAYSGATIRSALTDHCGDGR